MAEPDDYIRHILEDCDPPCERYIRVTAEDFQAVLNEAGITEADLLDRTAETLSGLIDKLEKAAEADDRAVRNIAYDNPIQSRWLQGSVSPLWHLRGLLMAERFICENPDYLLREMMA